MSERDCCGSARRGRVRGIAGTVLPAAVLAVLPKCPACLAAWLVAATGIGISMPAAAWLRGLILVSCLACLAWVAARQLRRQALRS